LLAAGRVAAKDEGQGLTTKRYVRAPHLLASAPAFEL
jgi:hypothetical protein